MTADAFTMLYDETTDETRDVKVGGSKGRSEALIDSSGIGVAVISTRTHPNASWKVALTLTNDDQAAIIIAPWYRVVGSGVSGQFTVGLGAPVVGV